MISISYDTIMLIAAAVIGLFVGISYIVIRDTAKLPDISTRMLRIEHIVNQMLLQLQVIGMMSDPSQKKLMFRSSDGKHIASSPEELIQKIINDPDTDEDDLKKYFEDMLKDKEEDEEDEEL